MMSQLSCLEEDSGDPFGGESVFVVVQTDGGDSIDLHAKLAFVLGEECSHEAAEAGIDVERYLVLEGECGDVVDGVDDAMGIVGV